MEFDAIAVGDRVICVRVERARLRNAHAGMRGGAIVIRLPLWMKEREAGSTAESLYRRIKRAIEKDPGRFLAGRNLEFRDGNVTSVAGRQLSIMVMKGARRYMARLSGDSVLVYAPDNYDERIVSRLAAKAVARAALPYLEERIARINSKHFNSVLGSVRVRDNSVVWGSCSPNNDLSINLKLLYAPENVLDYVITHELAHTKVRSHSKRFWDSVAVAMPGYKEARRWLRESSHLIKA